MAKDLKNLKIVITGGGSGGHISPAEAIIQELKDRDAPIYKNLLYIGGKLGMDGQEGSLEEKKFINAEFKFISIRSGKLLREFTLDAVKRISGVVGGLFDAYKELNTFKPDVIISTGGYVSVPVCVVGWLMRTPIYIHEQTAAVGLTNKITSKFAHKVFISFKDSQEYFGDKAILTGNPVRSAIFKTESPDTDLKKALDQMIDIRNNTEKPIVMFFGGGQGSHIINENVGEVLPELLEKYQIVLQTGDNQTHNDFEVLQVLTEKLPERLRNSLHITKFVATDEIGNLFNVADFYVGRAGANFVYEMGAIAKPSIFVPIPWVTHNEQYKNAKVIVKQGFGRIILQGRFSHATLEADLDDFWKGMKGKEFTPNRDLFPIDAAKKIVDQIMAD